MIRMCQSTLRRKNICVMTFGFSVIGNGCPMGSQSTSLWPSWLGSTVAILLVTVMSTTVISGSVVGTQSSNGWFREIPAGEGKYDEKQTVIDHAPTFLQWVVDHDRHLDFMVSINYDLDPGNVHTWKGLNNWEHADKLKHKPKHVLYAGIIAITENQFYLVYYFFHPRDHKFLFHHENDLEGALLAVDRKTQQVIHVQALAHGLFDERHHCNVANTSLAYMEWHQSPHANWTPFFGAYRPRCSEIPLDQLVVTIEGKGHGAHLFSARDLGSLKANQEQFIKYVYGGDPKSDPSYHHSSQLTSKGWFKLNPSAFDVKPIWPLFRGMYRDNGSLRDNTELYSQKLDAASICIRGYGQTNVRLGIYRGMKGDDGLDNRARFPWGEGSNYSRFLDPIEAIITKEPTNRKHPHSPISCDYQFNPYLQTLFDGKIPRDSLRFEHRRQDDFFPKRCD